MLKKTLAGTFLLAATLTFTGCKKEEEATPQKSLYDRLGGVNAITAVVDQFMLNVAADPKMVRAFTPLLQDVTKNGGDPAKSARFQSLRSNLIDQIGQASGGPQTYKGKDMATAHKGMAITDDEFNSLVNDLVASLNKFSVPSTEQTELLSVLGGLKSQIVGK